jgi:hypothetical protein
VIDLTLYAVPAFVFLMILEAVVGTAMLQRNVHDDIRDTAASLAMGVGSVFINLAWKVVVFGYSWTTPFTSFWFWTPMPLLGFDPMMVLSVQSISLLYQFWIHTELIGKMGLFEKVFNTPSHHRVHHGSNLRYLDRNHAGILIVWDKLFGTFQEEDEPVVYGLTKNIHSYNPIEIAIHEWRALIHDMNNANGWRESFGYALQPPGWSPDGSTLTADQLRAALAVEHA